MSSEVDYFQVGNGETSGDCIALRFGDLHSGDPNKQWIVVIDGGFQESGEKLAEHISNVFGTTHVDLVIATHLDRDHIAGLTQIIENFTVGKLMMQRPWLHSVDSNSSYSNESSEARNSYKQAASLEDLALEKGIEIVEPFAGGEIVFADTAKMTVLGPSLSYYEKLLESFEHNKSALDKLLGGLNTAATYVENALRKIQETLDPSTETLDHVHKNTSAENNSSAIIYFDIEGHRYLFTGDAGVDALHQAADYAEITGIDLSEIDFLHVPHHGSKHNLDSRLLDRVGADTAFISVTKASKKHPSPRVINALVRRDTNVFTTEELNIRHNHMAPGRPGYTPISPFTLIAEFEDDA